MQGASHVPVSEPVVTEPLLLITVNHAPSDLGTPYLANAKSTSDEIIGNKGSRLVRHWPLLLSVVIVTVSSLLFTPSQTETAAARRPSIHRRDRRPDREVSVIYSRTRRKHSVPTARNESPRPDQEEEKPSQDRRETPAAEQPSRSTPSESERSH